MKSGLLKRHLKAPQPGGAGEFLGTGFSGSREYSIIRSQRQNQSGPNVSNTRTLTQPRGLENTELRQDMRTGKLFGLLCVNG